MDMGPCPKVHSLQLRKEYASHLFVFYLVIYKCWIYISGSSYHTSYEEARAKGVDSYDVELENVIDKLIVECDKKIGRALKRLEDEDAKAAIAISVTEVTQVTGSSITTLFIYFPFMLFCFLNNLIF